MPEYSRHTYHTKIIVDEAYHDYSSEEVVAFTTDKGEQGMVEFAAFEESTESAWEISSEVSW